VLIDPGDVASFLCLALGTYAGKPLVTLSQNCYYGHLFDCLLFSFFSPPSSSIIKMANKMTRGMWFNPIVIADEPGVTTDISNLQPISLTI
jgi:hypothetical protein